MMPDALRLRQEQLLALLACPHCGGEMSIDKPVVRDDGIAAADLGCPRHGRVGVIDRHRPSFLERDLERIAPGGVADRRVELTAPSDLVTTAGRWWPLEEGWAGAADPGVAMAVEGRFTAARFEVMHDGWSPIVAVVVDGVHVIEADLSSGDAVELGSTGMADERHRVELRVVGVRPEGRVVVTETTVEVGVADVPAPGWSVVDRGNPFPPTFLDLVRDEPTDAVVLDCGGGDRRLGDPRVFNLEYLPYDAPDLYGDGLALPLGDDSVDLVLSQAVLEHVVDPQLALDEIRRILRPRGRIYAEIAFTQPLHAVPSHYFNVTPHGAAHLFRDWDVERLDWFGGIASTVDWWLRILELDHRWDLDKLTRLRDLLDEVDTLTSHEQLENFASGVLVVATAPA